MIPSGAAPLQHSVVLTRLLLFALLAGGEMLATSLLFTGDLPRSALQDVQYYLRQFVLLCAAGALAFVVVSWPKRHALIEGWIAHVTPGSWRLPLAVNLALFVLLAIASVAFSRYVATINAPPWGLYSAYLVLLAATGVSLMWVASPFSVWHSLVSQHRMEVAMAAGAGLIALFAGVVAQAGWSELAGVTLKVSYRMLSLYEANVQVDYNAHCGSRSSSRHCSSASCISVGSRARWPALFLRFSCIAQAGCPTLLLRT